MGAGVVVVVGTGVVIEILRTLAPAQHLDAWLAIVVVIGFRLGRCDAADVLDIIFHQIFDLVGITIPCHNPALHDDIGRAALAIFTHFVQGDHDGFAFTHVVLGLHQETRAAGILVGGDFLTQVIIDQVALSVSKIDRMAAGICFRRIEDRSGADFFQRLEIGAMVDDILAQVSVILVGSFTVMFFFTVFIFMVFRRYASTDTFGFFIAKNGPLPCIIRFGREAPVSPSIRRPSRVIATYLTAP